MGLYGAIPRRRLALKPRAAGVRGTEPRGTDHRIRRCADQRLGSRVFLRMGLGSRPTSRIEGDRGSNPIMYWRTYSKGYCSGAAVCPTRLQPSSPGPGTRPALSVRRVVCRNGELDGRTDGASHFGVPRGIGAGQGKRPGALVPGNGTRARRRLRRGDLVVRTDRGRYGEYAHLASRSRLGTCGNGSRRRSPSRPRRTLGEGRMRVRVAAVHLVGAQRSRRNRERLRMGRRSHRGKEPLPDILENASVRWPAGRPEIRRHASSSRAPLIVEIIQFPTHGVPEETDSREFSPSCSATRMGGREFLIPNS